MASGISALGNLLGKVNANGALVVTLDGGAAAASSMTVTSDGLVTTSTDGVVVQDTTAATVGVPVQISPRVRLSGRGWDVDDAVSRTVSFFTEALPVSGNTVSGTWKLGFIDPVAATITYPLTVSSAGAVTPLSTITTAAGTTAIAPLIVTNGTNLSAATANAIENDGAAFYTTQDTTNGRRYNDSWNYFRLTGSGTGITSIADFFGSNDGIPLVANGVYEIEWHCWFSQATAGTATWTIVTATTALANLNAEYWGSNIAGIGAVGAPQMAGVVTTASSSTALPVTGTEANAATHYFLVKAFLTAGNGSSNTRLRLTMSAGTATPLINSYFRVRRLAGGNAGAFVA